MLYSVRRWTAAARRHQVEVASLSAVALSAIFVFYLLASNIVGLDTWLDEGNYLAKGWWYVNGDLEPYSTTEPTLYMPLFFYFMGWLQLVFGEGYTAGRVFSVICGLGILGLTSSLTLRLSGSVVAAGAAALLLAGQFAPWIYYSTATPYSIVALLSLTTVSLLASKSIDRRVVWLTSGVLFWLIFFIRPNMLVFALVPGLWLFLFERPRGWVTFGLLAAFGFLFPSLITIGFFGYGLLETIMRTPGLATISEMLGLFRTDFWQIFGLTTSPFDPIGQWSEIGRTIRLYLVQPYAVLVAAVLSTTIWRLFVVAYQRVCSPEPVDVLSFYVIVAAALHLVLSQSYCVPCIMPYTAYFVPFAAVVGGVAVGALVGRVSSPSRTGTLVLASVATLGVLSQVVNWGNTLLRTPGAQPSTKIARDLALELRPLLPAGGRVAVISSRPLIGQAVWLAGGVVEPLTMNFAVSYREFREDVPAAVRVNSVKLLRRSGFWNADLLSSLITDEAGAIVAARKGAKSEPYDRLPWSDGILGDDTIAKYFHAVGTIEVEGYLLDVLVRTP
ncbi:MAG: hypothetical protein K8F25_01935 [Fimbriimonadaceae bacterium]|nr:hypothetical protein [Alphaproteobacteria bacterium]